MKLLKRTPALVLTTMLTALLGACGGPKSPSGSEAAIAPLFEVLQPKLFSSPGAETNAWADFDGDNDLDLFVGFKNGPNRLYRNDQGTFVDVAPQVGLADSADTRAVAWGDFDGDGDLDLYVGFSASAHTPNRLYRNDDHGHHFVNVAPELGLARSGDTGQPVWVDYDGDGDPDLFVAFRDQGDRLYRNDGGTFKDVTGAAGLGKAGHSSGAVWFDMDGDGDLDLFLANRDGQPDAVYVNQGDGTFVEAPAAMGMSAPGRTAGQGGIGVAVTDYDNDGNLDLLETTDRGAILWRNMGDGHFQDVAPGTPLAADSDGVAAAWGDFDDDGWPDLYVSTSRAGDPQAPDHLFRNVDGKFSDVTPKAMLEQGANRGVAWADYDFDGDLDLALANDDPQGTDPLYVNGLPNARARRSLEVAVVDQQGRWTFAGAKVTLTAETDADHPVHFTTARLVDAGGGYASQGAQPVHFGLPAGVGKVDIKVEWFEKGQRRMATVSGVDPARFYGQWLTLHLGVR